ncbi:MAG TPA: transcriptional regulator, partial [Candidatus Eisenbacteria bacterium]
SRALAAFHLDKLVEAGLLQATFRRLRGRGGPGAGRPPKLYRRSSTQLDISLPRRRYELAAHILAQALAQAQSEATLEALRTAAHEWGKQLAGAAGGGGRGSPLRRASRALEACGYEPHGTTGDKGELVLRNCPFDSVRTRSRDLICGMNLALIEGLLAGLGVEGVRAMLSPRPGMCCVALRNLRAGE